MKKVMVSDPPVVIIIYLSALGSSPYFVVSLIDMGLFNKEEKKENDPPRKPSRPPVVMRK